jgi:hypothetical protein
MDENVECGTRNSEYWDKANPKQFCPESCDSAFPVPRSEF